MSVLDLVARETRRAGRFAQVAGAALPAVVAVALLTGGAMWLARGRWMALPRLVPFAVWLGAIALAALMAVRARRRLGERSSAAAVALAIEEEQQLRRGALTGLLEVAPQGGPFVSKAADALGARLAGVQERPAPRHRRRLRLAAALSFIALLQVLTLASTSFAKRADGWRALLNPVDAWRGTLLPALAIDELPRRLPRGGQATIGIAAEGRSSVVVRWRPTGAGWRDTLLAVSPEGRAALVLNAVDADLALVADDGRTESDTAHVRVVDRPFVGDVTVRATYPGYLGRAPERLAADAPIRIPAGTRLDIDGHSSAPLEAVALRTGDLSVPLRAYAMTFGGRMVPRASATWDWEARGLRQEIADLPAPLEIEVVADSVPHVEILAPVGEVLIGPQGRVLLDILAQDDHAVTGVWLRRWVVDARGVAGAPSVVRISEERASEWVGVATQELTPLGLEPGMQLRIQAFARDAAPGDGREGASATLVLRIPTTDEERRAAREAGDAAVESALAAARAQAKLGEQTETAARSRSDRGSESRPGAEGEKDRKAMGFENAEQAKEIGEQQKELQERVAGLEEAARDMEDRLRRAGALDTALARQLHDAQKMLREAMTPEMLEAMSKLESSSQQLDGDRTRQSLQDLAQQQQRLRETLEKSAQMLKRAAMEGAMQTLADEAKELATEQRQFADSTGGASGTAPDSSRASQLAGKTQDLAKAMEKLRERLEQERAQTGADEAAKAEASAERSEALLKEAQARTRDANRPMQGQAQRQQAQQQARDAAQQAAQSMEQAAESMEKARSGQVSEWKGELNNALDQTVQEMLQLAKEQEELAAQARRDPNDPQLRSQQSALQQGVQTAQQRLQKEGQKSALVSPRTEQMMEEARQQVQQATRQSSEGQQRGGEQQAQSMQEAANSLRQAAAQLTRDRERASNAESASGLPEMMQQLQQLAQQQGSLNGQMQGLMPTQQQGQPRQGLDAAGRQQARELAKSQREVARALDEVADSDPTGRAQEMAREARMLAQALDQGAVDPGTAARQERLFRRLLDAGRSLEQEQKDESQRRESRAARGTERFTPPGGPARGRDAARYTVPTWEELRGLSAEERRLVIEYFRRLNAEAKP